MILTVAQMKAVEERAFADGVSAAALMEEAGAKIAWAVQQFFPFPGRCLVHFGKGHNGGDALVAARHLSDLGWLIEPHPAFPDSELAPLTRQHWEHLPILLDQMAGPGFVGDKWTAPPIVILDGLLGIGAGGELRDPIRRATQTINRQRETSEARVFALDLPTGLDGDTGRADPDTVVADYTLTIGFAKRGLLSDAATHFVGRLAVLPLDKLTARAPNEPSAEVATAATLAPLFPRRNFDIHKGTCGRVAIVAGSRGLTGAARLTSTACVRAGAGLISLFVTEDIYPIMAAACPPEVMVRPVKSYLEVLDFHCDVLAIGPGLGSERADEIRQILARAPQPTVVDADALNALADDPGLLARAAGPRLLTPHPGEMARLFPSDLAREPLVEAFLQQHSATLLLKGARTLIGQRGLPLSYNTTGSPGMATGGMGDVLTGVCAALAGQKLSLFDAARLGAWLCGRAAELTLVGGRESEESLTPDALIAHLGPAFCDLRCGSW